MNGYRVTESVDLRITESGDVRVTERFFEASASLSASGTLASTSHLKAAGVSSLTTVGSQLSAGERTQYGHVNISGTGSIQPDGDLKAAGSTSVSGAGLVASSGTRVQYGFSNLSGAGTITSEAGFKFVGQADIQGEGTFSSVPRLKASGSSFAFADNLPRITESGDIRITESGDTRVTNVVTVNVSDSSLVVLGTRVAFDSELYVKYSGNWKIAEVSVKNNNVWVTPISTYRYMNNRWKRIQ